MPASRGAAGFAVAKRVDEVYGPFANEALMGKALAPVPRAGRHRDQGRIQDRFRRAPERQTVRWPTFLAAVGRIPS